MRSRICGLALLATTFLFPGRAEFMRIGPVGLSLSLELELVFTSNIDQVPDSVYEGNGNEKEDYYIVYGFALTGQGEILRDVNLDLSVDLSREKHFIRDDLDTDDEVPIVGNVHFDLSRNVGRYTFGIIADHEAETQWEESELFVAGRTNLIRDIIQMTSVEALGGWQLGAFTMDVSYLWEWERHIEEYREGDKDTETFSYGVDWQVSRYVSLFFEYEKTLTDLLYDDTPEREDSNENYGINIDLAEALPIKHPQITYSFAYVREVNDGEDLGDDFLHTVTIDDLLQIRIWEVNMEFSLAWQGEHDQEEEDIQLTYTFEATHQINPFMRHSLTATREPADQFGVVQEAHKNEVEYTFTWNDVLIRDLTLEYTYTYNLTEPVGANAGPDEETQTWDITVDYTKPIVFAKINATAEYTYAYEQSDVVDAYDVHELRILFTYNF